MMEGADVLAAPTLRFRARGVGGGVGCRPHCGRLPCSRAEGILPVFFPLGYFHSSVAMIWRSAELYWSLSAMKASLAMVSDFPGPGDVISGLSSAMIMSTMFRFWIYASG